MINKKYIGTEFNVARKNKQMNRPVFLLSIVFALSLFSCSNSPFGNKIKDPLRGSSYESNNRFWRAVGKGTSRDEQIAVKKARINAKGELASQVNSIVKSMADQYVGSTEFENKDEITGKFQDLIRLTVNTEIADLRLIKEVKYKDKKDIYTVFAAYEIKKKSMLKHLKKQHKLRSKKQKSDLMIQKYLEEKIKETDE